MPRALIMPAFFGGESSPPKFESPATPSDDFFGVLSRLLALARSLLAGLALFSSRFSGIWFPGSAMAQR